MATTTTSGASASTSLVLRPDVVADLDAEALQFGKPPVDDADQLLAARVLRGEPDLAAGLRGGLQHDHRMAALGGDARRLEPGGAGADHHHFLQRAVGLRPITCGIVASRPVAALWMHSASPPS